MLAEINTASNLAYPSGPVLEHQSLSVNKEEPLIN